VGNRTSPAATFTGPTAVRQHLRILCVDSPSGLTNEPPDKLDHHGIEIRKYGDGVRALLALSGASPTAVLVPTDVVGVSLLMFVEAVAQDSRVPVIVGFTQDLSSGRSAFAALDAGACALLALPFDWEALISTMRAISRQSRGRHVPLQYGAIRLFREEHEVYVGDVAVGLSLKEFRTVEYLLSQTPRVVTAKEIAGLLHLDEPAHNATRVRKHMQRLRYKLDAAQPGSPTLLTTLKGVGYRLTTDTTHA
jgi:two-component system, OmpR family, response regulator RegX3